MMNCAKLAELVQPGELVSLSELCERAGRSNSTHMRHTAEICVAVGYLERCYGWTGRSTGWLYFLPGTIERLPGIE